MFTEVVLVSGGVDSTLAAHYYPVAKRLFVDYGQPYAAMERKAVQAIFGKVKEVKISGFDISDRDSFVPCRNIMLATLAVQFGGRIILGGMKDDNVEDNKAEEFTLMSHVLSRYARKEVEIVSPFFKENKADAISLFLKLNPPDLLYKTVSCFSPRNGQECLDCPACLRKNVAFHVNRMKSKYLSQRIIRVYLNKIHTYDRHRQWTFFNYLNDKHQVAFVDIDGVLADGGNGIRYGDKKPNLRNIKKLRALKKFRVLWTARREVDRGITTMWLMKHRVEYDCLLMEKPNFEIFYDDKARTRLP